MNAIDIDIDNAMIVSLKSMLNKTSCFIKERWGCLLILLAFIGFISKSLYNYPIGIMALLGLYQFIQSPKDVINNTALKLFGAAFFCLWLPMFIAFPDAVNHSHSAKTIFPYLRFYFAGIFIINELSKNNSRLNFVVKGIFFIVLFWSIDASIQFVFKQNLLGFPYEEGHITGMFYPRNTISHICSILSGFVFLFIYQNLKNNKKLLFSLFPLFFILLLSGRRAAWIMLALSTFGFFVYVYIYSSNKIIILKTSIILGALISILLASTIIFHEPTNARFKVTMGLFSADYEKINNATAVRLPIWETAISVVKDNPVNGIGPRGFRYVYRDYSTPENYWHKHTTTQPHLLILEITAETGLIGVSGYILLITIILILAYQSKNRELIFPFLIPVLVSLFPLNSHMAFYGSIWSSMCWLLIALYFSKINLINKQT